MKRQIKRWLRGGKAAQQTPPTPSMRDIGDQARDRGDWTTAVACYQQHLIAEPRDFPIHVQLGHALKEAGRLDEAAVQYQQAAMLQPTDADLLLSQGHLAKLRGDLVGARRHYQASFDVDANAKAALELATVPPAPSAGSAPNAGSSSFGVVDRIHGPVVEGWAITGGKKPATVEILRKNTVIATIVATNPRKDVAAAGLGPLECGFIVDLRGKVSVGDALEVRIKGSRSLLENGNVLVRRAPGSEQWTNRFKGMTAEEVRVIEQNCERELAGRRLSIVMPVYNTPKAWLTEAIDSVLDQWCPNFELICVDDASPEPHVLEVLEKFAALDKRVKIVRLASNSGIARSTNAGIAQATGDYVAFMDHDDFLEQDAVYRMLEATQNGADLVYSDEVLTGPDIDDIWNIVHRTAFSHDYYMSHPYFVHMIAVRREIVERIRGYDEALQISADVDFVLRALEHATVVAHVPVPLYRWRTHASSSGHSKADQVTKTMLASLTSHLDRMGVDAKVSEGLRFNNHRVDYPDDREKTLIIIPTKDRIDLVEACLNSIWATVDPKEVDIVVINHESREGKTKRYFETIRNKVKIFDYSGLFNYSRMNNVAFKGCYTGQKFVLFMNNDIEAIEPGWLERMRSLASRREVGVVGSTLLYGEGTIQHAGVVIGIGGAADHSHKMHQFKLGDERQLGFNCSLVASREYSAVTAACMMMRSEIFEGVGGFDEEFAIGFNDTDLCLRIGQTGRTIINDPYVVLYHHESATRSKTNQIDHPADGYRFISRWKALLSQGDPFYNPWLSKAIDHTLSGEHHNLAPARERLVRPKLLPLSAGRVRRVLPPIRYPLDPAVSDHVQMTEDSENQGATQ